MVNKGDDLLDAETGGSFQRYPQDIGPELYVAISSKQVAFLVQVANVPSTGWALIQVAISCKPLASIAIRTFK